jgi:hypothetical protein
MNRRDREATARRPRGGLAAGELNRAVGWTSLAVGAGVGLVMGLWSFDGPVAVPAWIGEYGDAPRRMVRLGHIAFFGLGILNILLARALPAFGLGEAGTRTALHCMNFGNVFLPLTLFAAAAYRPLKYLLPFPAVSIFVALCFAAFGVWRRYAASDDDRV